MKEHKEFKLSAQSSSIFKIAIADFVELIRKEMDVCEIDTMRISIDINYTMPSPPVGIKLVAFKTQKMTMLYDGDSHKDLLK